MKWVLYAAWLISAIAMLGSLFFSEILEIAPCTLCWFQRVCVYPLAFILAIASYNSFFGIAAYIFPNVLGYLLISGYQLFLQLFPWWESKGTCSTGPSCTEKIGIGLGHVTIPMLSFASAAALFILVCILWTYSHVGHNDKPQT